MTFEIVATIAILVIMTAMLVSGKFNLGITAVFIFFALAATGIMTPKETIARFGEPSIILVCCVFVFSAAIFGTGVSDIIGNIINKVSRRGKDAERLLIIAIAVVSILASSVLPNTAVTAAMIPILLAAAAKTGVSRTRLLISCAIFCNVGGSLTLLGTPTNLVGKATLEAAGVGTLTFFDFTLVGAPIAILCVVYYLLVYKKLTTARYVEEVDPNAEIPDTKLNKKQWAVIIMFAFFVLSVIAESFLGTMPAFMIGMALSAIMVITGIMTEKQLVRDGLYDIPTWLFIVATMTLGDAFTKTGADQVMANLVINVLGEQPSELMLISVLFWAGAILTQFISNTGAAGIFCPVAISVAATLGADPTAAVVAMVVACNSSFLTPMSNPNNLIVSAPGKIEFGDWAKVGFPMVVISYIVCILILPAVWPMY
jgi:anion transporter